jgi:ORF6N domain
MISLREFYPNMFPKRKIDRRKIDNVEAAIYLIRGQRVMLDSDLAAIYQVTTKRLNEQLRRNQKRFPIDFAFQLARQEFMNLKSQFANSSLHGGRRYQPWVFTEHGAIMWERPQRRDLVSRFIGALKPLPHF